MDAATKVRYSAARRIARDAGALLLRHFGRLDSYEHKGAIDLVSVADRESEALVQSAILDAFPDDAIRAEENGSHPGTSGFEWVVDPLDGTTNFVHGLSTFVVSIGVLRDGRRVIGVCFAPVLGELFAAAAGQGATLNGRPIYVSATASADQALVLSGFPYDRRSRIDALLERIKRVLMATRGLRRMGAAAYDLCTIACGRADFFFEQGLHAWDIAAGTLIVEEAGGRVTGYSGAPLDLDGANILVSNGRLHDELGQIVGPV
ncbi:MAG: myo-inositol-1(or 4)-monophosphatase [Myxococcota bacterium]|jgi:myo-inositol-1(or 4)-monophosphatase